MNWISVHEFWAQNAAIARNYAIETNRYGRIRGDTGRCGVES
jgi:hypothetical protein